MISYYATDTTLSDLYTCIEVNIVIQAGQGDVNFFNSCFVVLQDDVLELMCDAMKKNISNTKCFLIDGYPRELEQGTRFENEVSRYPPVFGLLIDSFVVLHPA